jgi:hypothetical protein
MMALINPLILFLTGIIGRIGSWFLTAYLSGALRSMIFTLAFLTAVTALVYSLITQANVFLLQAIQGMGPMAQMMLSPIASMLPPSLGYCVSIIVSVWLLGIVYNMAKEIAKIKLRAAERAAGFFKA